MHHTTAHTVRDSQRDITKLSSHLHENGVTSADQARTTPPFRDPTEDGLAKLCNTSWVHDTLSKISSQQTDDPDTHEETFVALDYEITDTVQ